MGRVTAAPKAPTIYDAVPYRTLARPATHPDRMAVLGRIFGLDCPHPNAARVLEVGCGNGSNIIPMALSLPGSEFLGIDLATTAVQQGAERAAAAGVTNVRLEVGDIAELGAEIGEFDYVIAHGVFSWVPDHVREALLALIRRQMRPNGVAFISYNALPGDQIRSVVRQMLKVHTAGIEPATKKLAAARAFLDLLARAPDSAADIYGPLLRSEIGKVILSSDDTLFHDDLSEYNEPYYVSDFMAKAGRHGLQFLAETPFHTMSAGGLPDEMVQLLREMAAKDIVLKEQYLDYFRCRGFRQTLLCHREAVLSRAVTIERMRQFGYAGDVPRAEEPDGRPGVVAFKHANGSAIRTDNPMTIGALDAMRAAAPRSVPFEDLAKAAGADDEAAQQALAGSLFQMFGAGLIEPRLHEPRVATVVSERPRATPWAAVGAIPEGIATLYHEMADISDAARTLLALADGTRTVPEIARAAAMPEGEAREGLEALARLALLVG